MGNGAVFTNFGFHVWGTDIILQSDGKMVVAGRSSNYFVLARYQANGALDFSFDGDGKVETNWFGLTIGDTISVIQQNDGNLVAIGSADGNFVLARYLPDGRLDNSFDGDSRAVADFGGEDIGRSIIQQSDGKLVVAGSSVIGNFALARYHQDGSLDISFGDNGKVITEFNRGSVRTDAAEYRFGPSRPATAGAYSIIQQSDGKLVVAGFNDASVLLARYNPDGTLDSSFNNNGKINTSVFGLQVEITSVTQQADGKLVVAGSANDNFILLRYNSDGRIDNSFDGDGLAVADLGLIDKPYSVIQQSDNKLVAAGRSHIFNSQDYAELFAVARFNPDGSADQTFDHDGRLTTGLADRVDPFNNVASARAGIIQQADGRLVAAGYTDLNPTWFDSTLDFALARYNDDGSLDSSFGSSTPDVVFSSLDGDVDTQDRESFTSTAISLQSLGGNHDKGNRFLADDLLGGGMGKEDLGVGTGLGNATTSFKIQNRLQAFQERRGGYHWGMDLAFGRSSLDISPLNTREFSRDSFQPFEGSQGLLANSGTCGSCWA
jgi:hypothetical protein